MRKGVKYYEKDFKSYGLGCLGYSGSCSAYLSGRICYKACVLRLKGGDIDGERQEENGQTYR